jgi:D-alanyl-D-alanine carboxypeptidase
MRSKPLKEAYGSEDRRRRDALPPLPTPDGLQPPTRADRNQLQALRRRAKALGVPTSYGHERGLVRVREPQALAFAGYDIYQRPQWLAPRAAKAWQQLRHAAARGQVELQLVSAFRSVDYQVGLIERKIARGQDMAQILAVSAAPGYSEHHSGRALDLTTPGYAVLEEEFEQSPAFRWLVHNAKDFGFRLSFPRGNPHGIAYEPWHWCWHARR